MAAILNPYYIDIIIFLMIYILLGLGLNLITGYAGQVSLGHAAFYGIGAYASAILSTRYGWNVWAAMLGAIIITFALSAILGLPSLRVREDFLAITTLGLGLVIQSFIETSDFTGGAYGIDSIPTPSILGTKLTNQWYLLLVLIVVGLAIFALKKMTGSRIGRAWRVISEDEMVAQSMGINTTYYKVLAFAIGGAYAGAAGALFAHHVSFISGESFGFAVSSTVLSMIVIGGLGTIRGTLLGVTILYMIPELFRLFRFSFFDMQYLDMYKMMIYGLLMVLVMRFRPKGIFGKTSLKALRANDLRNQAEKTKKDGEGIA